MARASQNERVVAISKPDGVTLTLNERETQFLAALIGMCNGPGEMSHDIYGAFKAAGYGWPYKAKDKSHMELSGTVNVAIRKQGSTGE